MKSQRGFTLVELSIVLVILGLLIGGVLTGQSLIRAAELRSATADANRYIAALNTFRDKYMALPGDMPNATRYWGAADSTPATCVTTASTDARTCDGNGDGIIDYDNGTAAGVPHEGFRAWQHLANAGLIEGQYNGLTYGASPQYHAGVNVPRAKINSGVWGVWYLQGRNMWDWAPLEAAHYLGLGKGGGGRWHYAVLKPEDAYNIDMKIDDGKPYTGRVNDLTTNTYTPTCTTSEVVATAEYALTVSSIACTLMIRAL